jgi:hypothetical protein
MLPINSTGRSKIDPTHERNFEGRPKFEILKGPFELYRFGLQPGLWWYGESLLTEMREEYLETSLSDARSQAVDVMMFPRDGLIEAWVGRTSPQPEWTTLPDGRILNGGLVQYLVYDLSKAPLSIFSKQTTVSLFQKWGKMISGIHPPK